MTTLKSVQECDVYQHLIKRVICLQLMHKLSVEAPPKILVERYLIEIAKNYNVPYEPDAMVRVSKYLFSHAA